MVLLPDFKLYPNPSSDLVTIKFDINSSDNAQVYIVDIMGKHIINLDKPITGLNQIQFSVENLTPSIYFVILDTDKGKRVKKLIVK